MTSKNRDVLENAVCVALLAAVAFVALLPSCTGERIPVSTDYIYELTPWSDDSHASPEPGDVALSRVQAERYYPWYRFLSDTVGSGDSLLWNSREGAGVPFMAVWRTRTFSPFSLPFYFFPLEQAFRISALLKLLVAGLCAFYAARRLGIVTPMALAVGVAFQLSGHVYMRLDAPLSDVVPWLPLLVLFAEQIASEHWTLWPFGSLVWALMLFGGDPETVTAAAMFTIVFLVVRLRLARVRASEFGGTFLALGLSMVLGTALASVQILPYIEFLSQAVSTGKVDMRIPIGLTDFAALFFPRIVSSEGVAPDALGAARLTLMPLLHIGVAPLVFIPLWFCVRYIAAPLQRERVDALLAAAATMLVLGVIVGLVRLPLLGLLNTEHFLVPGTLVGAIVTAVAAQHWLALNAPQCLAAIPRFLKITAVLFAVAILLFAASAWTDRPGVSPTFGSFFLGLLFLMASLALLGITLMQPRLSLLGYGLAAVMALNLFLVYSDRIPARKPSQVFPERLFIDVLQNVEGRITGSPELGTWPLAGNGIRQFYSSSGVVLRRHDAFTRALAADPQLIRRTGSSALLLTRDDIQGAFADLHRPSLKIDTVFERGAILYDYLDAEPRARMVYTGRQVETLDPAQLNADEAPLMETKGVPTHPLDGEAPTPRIDAESNGYLLVQVPNTPPGVLVVADAWYPGWKVMVDGKEQELFAVDGLFRGVVLGEGSHKVEFFYDPDFVDAGLGISIAAGVLVSVGLAAAAFARYGRNPLM